MGRILYRPQNCIAAQMVFVPTGMPHMGGCWERLIGVTKNVLTKMQLEKTPTEERLRWYLYRVELLVNSRPLTHLPPDDDNELPITPNDLLLGSSSGLPVQVALRGGARPGAFARSGRGRATFLEGSEILAPDFSAIKMDPGDSSTAGWRRRVHMRW